MRLGKAVDYRSAGTVEFVYDVDAAQFYFLEVNTRLQVEHGVTEEVGGVDLVEWMIRTAAGDAAGSRRCTPRAARPRHPGARLCRGSGARLPARERPADPASNYRAGVRVDGWVETGTEVSGYYDPMLAKIIARGATRDAAIAKLAAALAATRVDGIETNLRLPARRCSRTRCSPPASRPRALLSGHALALPGIEVLAPGTLTTVQDWPGRLGLWDVGVPPSGSDGRAGASPRQSHRGQRRQARRRSR